MIFANYHRLNMHKLIALLCLLFITISTPLFAHTECNWEEVQPRTAKLKYNGVFGTGYFLNDTSIMTAYHTIDGVGDLLKATHFKDRDLSVMHISPDEKLIKMIPVQLATPIVGEEVVLFGFPFDIYQIQISSGVVMNVNNKTAHINGFVTHGMSGGAVFVCRNSKPYLIGAIRSYTSYENHNLGHSIISLVNYSEFKAAAGLK